MPSNSNKRSIFRPNYYSLRNPSINPSINFYLVHTWKAIKKYLLIAFQKIVRGQTKRIICNEKVTF